MPVSCAEPQRRCPGRAHLSGSGRWPTTTLSRATGTRRSSTARQPNLRLGTMGDDLAHAPWGYDSWTHTEVIPKPPPIAYHWRIGPVRTKLFQPPRAPRGTPATESEITV